ncbi:hypothetical protein SH661x_002529 [Planctomicrobium sp. SH661]|uniref:hypothetical protein n=1 Tax=Planctomicrobium sp. SH661 TaxID=3448124 RepID=UPI003F5BDCBB
MQRRHCLAALASLVLSGCGSRGPALGKVTGKVTLNGKPVVGAGVIFNSSSGGEADGPAYGQTDESGMYTLRYGSDRKGAVPGTKKVMIEHNGVFYEDLTATVELGKNTIDFQLPETPEKNAGKGKEKKSTP